MTKRLDSLGFFRRDKKEIKKENEEISEKKGKKQIGEEMTRKQSVREENLYTEGKEARRK